MHNAMGSPQLKCMPRYALHTIEHVVLQRTPNLRSSLYWTWTTYQGNITVCHVSGHAWGPCGARSGGYHRERDPESHWWLDQTPQSGQASHTTCNHIGPKNQGHETKTLSPLDDILLSNWRWNGYKFKMDELTECKCAKHTMGIHVSSQHRCCASRNFEKNILLLL